MILNSISIRNFFFLIETVFDFFQDLLKGALNGGFWPISKRFDFEFELDLKFFFFKMRVNELPPSMQNDSSAAIKILKSS